MLQCDPNMRCNIRVGARQSITADRYQVNFRAILLDLASVREALEHGVACAALARKQGISAARPPGIGRVQLPGTGTRQPRAVLLKALAVCLPVHDQLARRPHLRNRAMRTGSRRVKKMLPRASLRLSA